MGWGAGNEREISACAEKQSDFCGLGTFVSHTFMSLRRNVWGKEFLNRVYPCR